MVELECQITFPADGLVAQVPRTQPLSRTLTAKNSPLLFGCRTGLCGTCLVKVTAGAEQLTPASAEEREVLAILVPDEPLARLACQIDPSADFSLEILEESP